MKIVLIQPPQNRISNDRLEPPLGLMYLSAILKQDGHEVFILDFSGGFQHQIPETDIYGFSTFTPSYSWSLAKRDEVRKQYPDKLIIAGGCHVSALPQECQKDWDAIVVGEGELGIKQVINGETGLIYGKPIDSIPLPDYDSIDINSYTRLVCNEKSLSVLSSRGCYYNCAFCNSIIMGCGNRVRLRSLEAIADEIRYLQNRFGIKAVRFVDDLFACNELRVETITQTLLPLGITYRCHCRVNLFTKKMAEQLKNSGCVHIAFGAESGSDKILGYMNKHQTANDIRRAIGLAKEAGIAVRCYLIVGFPGETWDTVTETINLMLECQPDEILVFAPIPFPGTALYNNPSKYGIRELSKNFDDYMQIETNKKSNYLFSHSTATAQEIKEMREYVIERLASIRWVS